MNPLNDAAAIHNFPTVLYMDHKITTLSQLEFSVGDELMSKLKKLELKEELADKIEVHCWGSSNGYECIFTQYPKWNIAKPNDKPDPKNNRSYLHAALAAIRCINEKDPTNEKALLVKSNSINLIRSMKELVRGWKKNGWKTYNNKPVANQDLIRALDEEKGNRPITWEYVKKH